MTDTLIGVPDWARDLLVCPHTRQALRASEAGLVRADGTVVGRLEHGVVRFAISPDTDGIRHYRAIGGAHFHERKHAPFSMSALDTAAYHAHLADFRGSIAGIIVDIGGGDGRNAMPFLEWGHCRLVVIDAAGAALVRFRERLVQECPGWIDRVLLVEADARSLPLVSGCAERVLGIEALYYLNEEYELGLREARRLLGCEGLLLLSERDYEGGLIMRLLHYGLDGMLQSYGTRSLWDGATGAPVRTRCFTETELTRLLAAEGLRVTRVAGIPLLPLLLGWLRAQGRIGDAELAKLPMVHDALAVLAREGQVRRCHVITAKLM